MNRWKRLRACATLALVLVSASVLIVAQTNTPTPWLIGDAFVGVGDPVSNTGPYRVLSGTGPYKGEPDYVRRQRGARRLHDDRLRDRHVSTIADGAGVGTATASVRAERTGVKGIPGDGRVYQINFRADDGKQNGTCDGSVFVGVPHDQGRIEDSGR